MRHRRLEWLRPGLERTRPGSRLQFGVRLVLTLLLTMGIVGVAQYALAARQLTRRVLEQTVGAHHADAAVLHRLYKDAAGDPWKDVGELLNHVAQRPGVQQVSIIAPDGTVAAVGRAGHTSSGSPGGHRPAMPGMPSGGIEQGARGTGHGSTAADSESSPQGSPSGHGDRAASKQPSGVGHQPTRMHPATATPAPPMREPLPASQTEIIQQVLRTGQSYAGPHPGGRNGESAFAVPLDLGGSRHVLHVVKEGSLLRQQLTDMRWVLLLTLSLALVIGLPLFHVLGGRALNARHQLALRHSNRDSLTGVGNHRSFQEEIRSAVELARRHGHRLALALVDLDHFKQVNDTNGHRRGDEVLVEVAQILKQVRTEDRVFRIGGDELAILFPATDAAGAHVVCERIRARVEADVEVVTTSIGIAELGLSTPDVDSLIECADAAMYAAKRRGKNQVVVHQGPGVVEISPTVPV
jgi:diguanylate cyclase (GGDEF)-like protein